MPEATPAPAVAPTPEAPKIDVKASPFASLDSKASVLPPKPAATPPPKEGMAPAPEKVTEKTTPTATGKEDRTAKDPKWFREQHEKAQNEIKTYAERVKSLESKIADAEARGKDVTVLSERLAQLEKERDEAKAEARAAKQELSPEFQEKWEKPFNQAAEYARNIVTQLQAGEWKMDENTGNRIWEPTRSATWEDFAGLYSMPMNKAAAMARQMFGDDASIVIQQLTDLHRRDYERSTALNEEKARWKENTTKEQAERATREQGFKAALHIAEKHLAEVNPYFHDAPEDNDSKALRDEGYRIFDARPQTFQEAVVKQAEIKHRVAAHGPLVRKVATLEAELKEARTTIEELRGNGPGKTGRSTESKGGEKSWQEELRSEVPTGVGG